MSATRHERRVAGAGTANTRGSASRGAPSSWRGALRALVAAALLGASGWGPACAAVAAAGHGALRFGDLPWDTPAAAVARWLPQHGWARSEPSGEDERPAWRGKVLGRTGLLTPEFDADGRLLAVDVLFVPAGSGGALQRYATLVAAVRARHGAAAQEIAPGRPVVEQQLGRIARVRRIGPLTAATLWTAADGAAAAVQLDGEGRLWLRYESPRWQAAQPAADSAGD